MPARGIDHILPHSCSPILYEPYVRHAHVYVELAERAHGPIPKPASYAYIWGYALKVLHDEKPQIRIINLETSVTCSEDYWQDKSIHYRLHPLNIELLHVAHIDCCTLANNHSMDWGLRGLIESLETLGAANIACTGAGRNLVEASAPAVLKLRDRRVLVYGLAASSSGVPEEWAATAARPGVHFVEELSKQSAQKVVSMIQREKKENDIVVLSIHWGDNWGYEIPQEQIDFAHELIDSGTVHLVHGHSSHHPKGMEVYRGGLILYGCGDFITDYEGIRGHEEFHGDLTCMYFVSFYPNRNIQIRIVPVRIKNFQVKQASEAESDWLLMSLRQASSQFHLNFKCNSDQSFTVDLSAEGHA